jgi:hypothetical protein
MNEKVDCNNIIELEKKGKGPSKGLVDDDSEESSDEDVNIEQELK